MALPTVQWLRDKSLVLVTASVFQPVSKATLEHHLAARISSESLSALVQELVDEQMLVCEGGQYRLTMRGQGAIVPRKGNALRDIQRMLYLVQSTGGGLAMLDDDSSPLV